jgi:hypothetical protein
MVRKRETKSKCKDTDAADAFDKLYRAILSRWMIKHSFSTGHGDKFVGLLRELSWQVEELRNHWW